VIFPFRSRRALPLLGIFGSMIILLMQGANLARGDLIIPPSDLSPGDLYQLIFVTAGTRNAASDVIAEYNTFVTQQAAALNPHVPVGTTWFAVASTYDVASASETNARDNAAAYPDIPIYNTHGQRVANGYADLWDGFLQNPIKYDQFGTALPDDTIVWTGSKTDGKAKYLYGTLDGPLGSLDPNNPDDHYTVFGSSTSIIGKWINRGSLVDFFEEHSFYGLSSEVTVKITPEPGALVMLGMGAVVLLCFFNCRRKVGQKLT
jgi:hypothetical protein